MPTILSRGGSHPAFPIPACAVRRYPKLAFAAGDVKDSSESQLVSLILVPMEDGTEAVLSYDSFKHVMANGFSDQFFIHSNGHGRTYVATSHPNSPGKVHTVARIVLRARRGERVRYTDRDPRNLLESNLQVGEGFSKGHEARAVRDSQWGVSATF